MRGRPTRGWAGQDRSLGVQEHDGANGKPYQLTHAENVSVGGGRTGELHATYDAAGGMTALTVRRDGACLPVGATCAQHFAYAWDELGRLVHARRWDVNAAQADAFIAEAPSLEETAALGTPAADLHYVYDSSDQRRLKRATDAEGETRHTAYVFASLELRQTSWGEASEQQSAPADYTRDEQTEVVYLFAHGVRLARLALDPALPRTSGGSATEPHVFLELGDHLGSTAAVLDLATSELVERATYLAYGAADSDYRPERWGAFREDYRFTGKEEDREVGLVYFGKRFLSPALGRWMSADPLAVHVPVQRDDRGSVTGVSADLNLYAYVSGRVLQAVDPVGLKPPKVTVNGSFTRVADGDVPNATPESGHAVTQSDVRLDAVVTPGTVDKKTGKVVVTLELVVTPGRITTEYGPATDRQVQESSEPRGVTLAQHEQKHADAARRAYAVSNVRQLVAKTGVEDKLELRVNPTATKDAIREYITGEVQKIVAAVAAYLDAAEAVEQAKVDATHIARGDPGYAPAPAPAYERPSHPPMPGAPPPPDGSMPATPAPASPPAQSVEVPR